MAEQLNLFSGTCAIFSFCISENSEIVSNIILNACFVTCDTLSHRGLFNNLELYLTISNLIRHEGGLW